LAGVDCLVISGAEELPPAAFGCDVLDAERGGELPAIGSETSFVDAIVETVGGADSDLEMGNFVEPDAKAAA
jgi:hypothetical protein